MSYDLAEVGGQESAKRILEVAAAGGHRLLLVGPAGTDRTRVARCLAGILPAPVEERVLSPEARPKDVRAALQQEGAVVVLDDLPRFSWAALTAFRKAAEKRIAAQILATMRDCPCGHSEACRCIDAELDGYNVSAAMVACFFQLRAEVTTVSPVDLLRRPSEPSANVARRVGEARERQWQRSRTKNLSNGAETAVNAALSPDDVGRVCRLDATGESLLDAAFHRLRLSAGGVHRILTVARTIADLAGRDSIVAADVAEAIQYDPFGGFRRGPDRHSRGRWWNARQERI